MKTYLTYGSGMALAGAILALAQYFLGFHEDVEKLQSKVVASVGFLLGLAICVVGVLLAMRAVREKTPDRGLFYGRGVATGALTGVFYGVFMAVFQFVYGTAINPEFHDLLYQAQMAQMEQMGAGAQAPQMEGMMRFFTSPVFLAGSTLIFTPILTTVVSLVVAAFVKRDPQVPPPVPVV